MRRKAQQVDEETTNVLIEIDDEEDARVCYAAVARRIRALEEEGKDVPEALLIAQRQLMTDLVSQSQGR